MARFTSTTVWVSTRCTAYTKSLTSRHLRRPKWSTSPTPPNPTSSSPTIVRRPTPVSSPLWRLLLPTVVGVVAFLVRVNTTAAGPMPSISRLSATTKFMQSLAMKMILLPTVLLLSVWSLCSTWTEQLASRMSMLTVQRLHRRLGPVGPTTTTISISSPSLPCARTTLSATTISPQIWSSTVQRFTRVAPSWWTSCP